MEPLITRLRAVTKPSELPISLCGEAADRLGQLEERIKILMFILMFDEGRSNFEALKNILHDTQRENVKFRNENTQLIEALKLIMCEPINAEFIAEQSLTANV